MKIAMIMLAAGNSRRFGANKLLYEIDGIPMYRHVLEQLDDTKKKIENIYSEYSDITEDNLAPYLLTARYDRTAFMETGRR